MGPGRRCANRRHGGGARVRQVRGARPRAKPGGLPRAARRSLFDTTLLCRMARAEIAEAEGRHRDAAGERRRGLDALQRARTRIGALDLQGSASLLGRELARAGLERAVATGSPAAVLAWAERSRAQALLLPPVRLEQDDHDTWQTLRATTLALSAAEARRTPDRGASSAARGAAEDDPPERLGTGRPGHVRTRCHPAHSQRRPRIHGHGRVGRGRARRSLCPGHHGSAFTARQTGPPGCGRGGGLPVARRPRRRSGQIVAVRSVTGRGPRPPSRCRRGQRRARRRAAPASRGPAPRHRAHGRDHHRAVVRSARDAGTTRHRRAVGEQLGRAAERRHHGTADCACRWATRQPR